MHELNGRSCTNAVNPAFLAQYSMQNSSDSRIWWIKFALDSPIPRCVMSLSLTGRFPEAKQNLPTLTGGGGHGQKPSCRMIVSLICVVLWSRPSLLMALELKIKVCELPAAQAMQHTSEPCAVCEGSGTYIFHWLLITAFL